MLLASDNTFEKVGIFMAEEKEKGDVQVSTSFTWQQARWALVLIFCFVSGGSQIKSWLVTTAIQQTANSAEVAATTATSKTSEIDGIKKDLAQTKAELKQYKLALDSWNDFFAEEQSRQSSSAARERYRQQRIRIREILKPISQNGEFFANPTLPASDTAPVRNPAND
jgi:hypothetical protein